MNRLHGHTHHPRVVATREHHSGNDVDYVHTVAADHPTALATQLVGLVVETAEGPVYANHRGTVHGPYADPAEAFDHLATLHAATHHPRATAA